MVLPWEGKEVPPPETRLDIIKRKIRTVILRTVPYGARVYVRSALIIFLLLTVMFALFGVMVLIEHFGWYEFDSSSPSDYCHEGESHLGCFEREGYR